MSERKWKIFGLTVLAAFLLLLGYLAYLQDGNFLWFMPGIIAYIINILYWAKKPPRIVYENERE